MSRSPFPLLRRRLGMGLVSVSVLVDGLNPVMQVRDYLIAR